MAIIDVTEYSLVAQDQNGRYLEVGREPYSQHQQITIGSVSAQLAAAFTSGTRIIRVRPDLDCLIEVGKNPIASQSSKHMCAGEVEYFGVNPGDTLAVIGTTGAPAVLPVRNGAVSASYNITAATVVKATPGRLVRISVVVAGSAAGTANDCSTTGAAAAANEICAIPNAIGVIYVDWPTVTGIVVVPGTGQTLAVNFE